MSTKLIFSNKGNQTNHSVLLMDKNSTIPSSIKLNKENHEFIKQQLKQDNSSFGLNEGNRIIMVVVVSEKKQLHLTHEAIRKAAHGATSHVNKYKLKSIDIVNISNIENAQLYFAEGMALSNYQFIKYFKDASKKKNSLETINVVGENSIKAEVENLNIVTEALYQVRDLVNEPVIYLNSVDLGKEVMKASKKYGFKAEVWNKKKIQQNNFGGLLAVNMGSPVEPTFSILEHKPAKPLNKKPIVLVGKGVVYDTGGLSIKPTPDSMDHMKCDMTGAAVVLGTFIAVAKSKLNLHIIGLIPSTDNRINGLEYTPGDIIKMHNGLFVEVLNTDAEGRMILADALSYAQKYNPELVIDFATLTGAAARMIGMCGHAIMGTADESVMKEFKTAGEQVYERGVELPMWEEYGDKMKSTIADLKNVGGADGGAITAGKFLENFTNYPYVHNDIAGPAFTQSELSYWGKGGTGYGMRLLYKFLKNRAK
jgi:leucyl aminopeptidase